MPFAKFQSSFQRQLLFVRRPPNLLILGRFDGNAVDLVLGHCSYAAWRETLVQVIDQARLNNITRDSIDKGLAGNLTPCC